MQKSAFLFENMIVENRTFSTLASRFDWTCGTYFRALLKLSRLLDFSLATRLFTSTTRTFRRSITLVAVVFLVRLARTRWCGSTTALLVLKINCIFYFLQK